MSWWVIAQLGLEALGAYMQYKATRKAGKAIQRVYERNAEITGIEAEYERWKGIIDLGMAARRAKKVLAQQRVAFAKAGVVLDTGTAELMALDTAKRFEEDKAIIEQNSAYVSQAALIREENLLRQGSYYAGAYKTKAMTSLLESGLSIARQVNWKELFPGK